MKPNDEPNILEVHDRSKGGKTIEVIQKLKYSTIFFSQVKLNALGSRAGTNRLVGTGIKFQLLDIVVGCSVAVKTNRERSQVSNCFES